MQVMIGKGSLSCELIACLSGSINLANYDFKAG